MIPATLTGLLVGGAVAATRSLIRGDQDAVEACLEAEAAAFEARLRSPEAQAAFMSFLGRAKPGTPS